MIRQLNIIAAGAVFLAATGCFDAPAPPASAGLTLAAVESSVPGGSPGAPLFDSVAAFTATVPTLGQPMDVYVPVFGRSARPAPLPVAILLQGALVEKRHYSRYARTLAAYGFIVAVPDGGRVFGVGPFIDLADVQAVLGRLQELSDAADSPIAGSADVDRLVLVGHSFGGAAAVDAAQDVCQFPFCSAPPDWRAGLLGVAVYGTSLADPFGGGVPEIRNNDVPVFVLGGDRDGVTDWGDVRETFSRVQNAPKGLIAIRGGNHYSITNAVDSVASVDDPNAAAIEQALAIETIARWTGNLLRAYCLGDAEAYAYVTAVGPTADANVDVVIVE